MKKWKSLPTFVTIAKATCYKNPEIPSCIDLIVTNSPRMLQNSSVMEIHLPDFHKMVVLTNFQKLAVDIAKTWNNFMAANLLWIKL